MVDAKALGFHSNTSMAVKAVIAEIKRQLATRFDSLQNIPDFFYDFDKGINSSRFKQFLAKIPLEERKAPWIALSYSYDTPNQSSIQPRNGFSMMRPVKEHLKRSIDFQYVELPLLCSVVTEDSKLLNSLAAFLLIKTDWSFSCKYQDLLWPYWLPGQTYPIGWYIRPTEPNGKLYMCYEPGTTANSEPNWITETDAFQEDGTVKWKCIEPDLCIVRAADFVKQDTVISNPIENGILYQLDFGYTLHYTEYDDGGKLVGIITNSDLNLLNWYREGIWKETIKVPD